MSTPTDSNHTKMEILAKSRRANQDEGLVYAEKRGNQIGVIVYGIIAIILMIFSVPEQMQVVYTIAALSVAFVFGGTFSMYRFTKEKFYLFGAIASAFFTIFFTLMVVVPILS